MTPRLVAPPHRHGFTVTELLVAIGIIAVLMGILLAVIGAARERSQQTRCASNLRVIGQTLFAYATEQRGWVPRDNTETIGIENASPFLAVGNMLRPGITSERLGELEVLHCGSHPLGFAPRIPTTYLSNALAFDHVDQPDDYPLYTTLRSQLSAVKRPSETIYLLEAADTFSIDGPRADDHLQTLGLHDIWCRDHLTTRLSYARHGRTSNVMRFDGSVISFQGNAQSIEPLLDDGMRGNHAGRVIVRIDH